MDTALLHGLAMCETDIEGAIKRFSGNEELYLSCLKAFLEDPTMEAMNSAIDTGHWDDAFTAAHALKGLAGNMGFVPLFHATGELVVAIRAGKVDELPDACQKVKASYDDIVKTINQNLNA